MTISREEWKATGQYPDGTPFNPKDKNLDAYYDNYKKEVEKAPPAQRKEIERQHGVIDTTTATEPEKEAYVEYVQSNPDLRENAEALGLTRQETAEFGQKHYETFGVGDYVYDPAAGAGVYGKNLEDRANYIAAGITSVIGDPGAFQRDYGASDEAFEAAIRGYAGPDNWLYDGGDPSQLWQARGLIGEEFGDPWNLQGFSGTGWNMSPDNPYAEGIRKGTIDVVTDVGQLLRKDDPDFLQDRYEDEYIKEDFPENWVDDKGNWQGPSDLGEYWNALSTAVRNEEGELRSLIPSSQWATGYDFSGSVPGEVGPGVGPGVGGLISTTPYTQPAPQDWSNLRHQFAGSPYSELAQVLNTPASRAMFGDEGAAMQSWTTGQGVPPGLINYQIPGGPQANVAYTGGNPGLFDFSANGADTGNGGETSKTHWEIMADHYDFHNIPHVGGVPTATA